LKVESLKLKATETGGYFTYLTEIVPVNIGCFQL